ncbi:MAG: hypothetical protein KatS3mg015_1690 [Fimbriimonadales bacterium]|nr:MAG: hypothetical protein KatS3mg015_1690 [Fimbriimonadales bacterium]
MRKWLLAPAAVGLILAGCGGPNDEPALADRPAAAPASASPASLTKDAPTQATAKQATHSTLVGRWKGEIVFPKSSKKKNPQDEMAEAMAKAFLSDLWIEFSADGTFKMNMMFPIEGRFEHKGNEVHLTPEKMMGMDLEEFAKMGGEGTKVEVNEKPMVLEVSKDGATLRAKGEKDDGELVFRRA